MAYLNKVMVIGNLVRDPELRYTNNGTAVCSMRLAVNNKFRTREGEDREESCFVDVSAFGRQAELCDSYLQKGAPAYVEGRLQLDQWEDKTTGRNRSKLEINARQVQFLGAPGSRGSFQDGGEGAGAQTSGNGDNQQETKSGDAAQPSSGAGGGSAESDDVDDQIPF